MGFYGNITYNTYGLQEKGVKPEHLDRSYWRTAPAYEVIGQTGLRTLLSLKEVGVNQRDIWDIQWAEAEKTCFKFYFSDNAENITLRKLYGNGYLLGWVRKNTLKMTDWTSSDNWTLYMVALNGERAGQMFYYPISPIKTEIELSTTDESNITDKGKLDNWLNDYLAGPVVTGKQIKNNSITTVLINDGAVTEDKIGDEEVSTIKIAGEAITEEKIAGYAISGGKIKERTISAYNIADGTITTQQIAAYTIIGGEDGNIAENTITNYNITDGTITSDKLQEQYVRGFLGKGYPDETTTENLVNNQGLTVGDLYIDGNNGYIYCYQGFVYDSYKWTSSQEGLKTYLEGKKDVQWPTNPNTGDIWVNENTGDIYIYRKISNNKYKWDPLHSYNSFSNGQIQFILNTPKDGKTGTYTFIYDLLISQEIDTNTYLFVGDSTIEDDSIYYDILSDHPNELYIGMLKKNPNINPETSHWFICTNVATGEKVKFYIVHEMVGNGVWGYWLRSENLQANQATVSFNYPDTPTLGTIYYRSETSSLQVYTETGWKDIEGYSTAPSTTATMSEMEEITNE